MFPTATTASAEGMGFISVQGTLPKDYVSGNVSFGFDISTGIQQPTTTVQNSGTGKKDDALGWSNLPKWQGLPDTHFGDRTARAVTDETTDRVAEDIYDKAYTQLLVGDLETAEEGFLRILSHYAQSSVAHRARVALIKVSDRRNARSVSDGDASDLIQFHMPGSSIEQLSIISANTDFVDETKVASADPKAGKMPVDLQQGGTQEDFLLNVGDRVFFAEKSARLTEEAKKLLAAQAEWLKAHKTFKLLIEGHADEEGPDHYNMALSANRAASVQQFFLSREIDPGRIQTRHFGKSQPVAICKKEDCSVQNRRAVTKLLPASSN